MKLQKVDKNAIGNRYEINNDRQEINSTRYKINGKHKIQKKSIKSR